MFNMSKKIYVYISGPILNCQNICQNKHRKNALKFFFKKGFLWWQWRPGLESLGHLTWKPFYIIILLSLLYLAICTVNNYNILFACDLAKFLLCTLTSKHTVIYSEAQLVCKTVFFLPHHWTPELSTVSNKWRMHLVVLRCLLRPLPVVSVNFLTDISRALVFLLCIRARSCPYKDSRKFLLETFTPPQKKP